jgi:cell division protein FtsW
MVGFGLVMVFSASSNIAVTDERYQFDAFFFVKRQLLFAFLGTLVMFLVMNIHYSKFKKWFLPLFVVVVAALILVPFVGEKVNGARSWFYIGSFGVQPSELAKISVILYLAALISKKGEKIKEFKRGLLPVLIIVGFLVGLIMLQPDLGSGMILAMIAAVVVVAGGARWKHLFAVGAVGLVSACGLIAYYLLDAETRSYRINRLTSFLNPWEDRLGSGFHLLTSLEAFGHGGLTGAGFGHSIQKLLYLPYPYNDFIFSVIGEEFGFIGTSVFLLFYVLLIWRGLIVSLRCSDSFGMLAGIGIVGMIAIQALINMGGVTGSIPITGVTLPFISYGGSSLIITMFSMGILLSISREYNKAAAQTGKTKTQRTPNRTYARSVRANS